MVRLWVSLTPRVLTIDLNICTDKISSPSPEQHWLDRTTILMPDWRSVFRFLESDSGRSSSNRRSQYARTSYWLHSSYRNRWLQACFNGMNRYVTWLIRSRCCSSIDHSDTVVTDLCLVSWNGDSHQLMYRQAVEQNHRYIMSTPARMAILVRLWIHITVALCPMAPLSC